MLAAPRLITNQVSTHVCVGVVQKPARGILQGEAVWSCRLLVSQVGMSARPGDVLVASQEMLSLRCQGVSTVMQCTSTLKHGDVVHVVSKLVQRPKYVAAHAGYFNQTDLLVSDSYGLVTRIACVQ